MKKIVFRFDIDTHKCIRDGVPNLLKLSRKYNVPFTFFLNTGKSISLGDSMRSLLKTDNTNHNKGEMMSAMQKLGIVDYIYAAIVNPSIICYKRQICELLNSNCEIGIHGGRNHAKWQNYALEWEQTKLTDEIDYAIDNIKKIKSDYTLKGFASPAWVHPDTLDKVLKKKGFLYCADYHGIGLNPVIINDKNKTVGVNLLGEPGGVAFFENCRVKQYSTEQIINYVMEFIERHEVTVLYDHPYYAGVKEIDCISQIIEKIQIRKDINICTLEQLL